MMQTHTSAPVGRLVGLWRYPVKSMACEPLERVDVSWFGLAGDRRWAFVRAGAADNGFPWFTLRERADMRMFRPVFDDPARPDQSSVTVHTPDGRRLPLADPALAAALTPDGARLMKQNRGIFDTFPVSLITTQTLAKLGEEVGTELDAQRFRPNLLIEATDPAPYQEDAWVGRELTVGALRLRIDQRDGRCVVVTIDPVTHTRRPEILRRIAQNRQGCLGVYGTVVTPAGINLGDPVHLVPPTA